MNSEEQVYKGICSLVLAVIIVAILLGTLTATGVITW